MKLAPPPLSAGAVAIQRDDLGREGHRRWPVNLGETVSGNGPAFIAGQQGRRQQKRLEWFNSIYVSRKFTLIAPAVSSLALSERTPEMNVKEGPTRRLQQQQQPGRANSSNRRANRAGPGRAAHLEERRGEGEALVDLVAREHAREAGGRERDVELAREGQASGQHKCELARASRWEDS